MNFYVYRVTELTLKSFIIRSLHCFCKLIIAAMFWPFLFNFTGSPTVPKDADGLVSHRAGADSPLSHSLSLIQQALCGWSDTRGIGGVCAGAVT